MDQPDFRAELQRLVDLYEALGGNWSPHGYTDTWNDALVEARTALATAPPEDNTKPGFINVCVEGPPPAPYENWEDWLVCTFKNRTIQRVYIRALISGDFSFDKKEVATPPPEVPSEKEIEQFVESIRMPWILEQISRATDPDPDFDVVIVRAALERWGR